METVIQIDDRHAFAFGLQWQTLDTMMSRSSQIAELRQNFEARWMASFKIQGQENIGYAKSLTPPAKIKTLSAAGQVALSEACKGKTVLVLLEEAGQGGQLNDVGVVALINGNVVHDAFVKTSEVAEIRRRFKEQCARAETEFVTMGKAITLADVPNRLDWVDLLPPPPGKGLARFKAVPSAPITVLKADIPSWVLAAVVGTLVIGSGIWYWQQSAAENERLRMLAFHNKAPDPAQLYAQSAAQLLAQPVMNANVVVRELRTQLKETKFPMRFAGWTLAKIDCGLPGCSALWTRAEGTFREFVDHAPASWGEIQLNPDGKRLMHNLPVKLSSSVLKPATEWTTEREFLLTEFSKWQRYEAAKFAATLKPVSLMAVPPSVQPQAAAALPNAIWAAGWEVTDAQWWMSEAMDTMPNNVTVELVSLSFNGTQVNFNAGGKVYVRNN
jgi:hypothetical protein